MDNERNELYIGLDDTNQGKYPELCLAYFSTISSDIVFRQATTKRDSNLVSRLQSPNIDYRFLLLEETNIICGKNNLVIACKSLIIPYLSENSSFEKLIIFIDGRLNGRDKHFLEEELSNYAEKIEIKGVIKRKKKVPKRKLKVYTQPLILLLADFHAHHLYTNFSLNNLHYHPKRVPFQS